MANIKINKREAIIIFTLLFIALAGFLFTRVSSKGSKVQIEVAQKIYGTYNLSIDQTIQIFDEQGHFLLNCEIKNSTIKVLTSECPDKICIDEGTKGQAGQTIVCLPNKVVIRIINDDSNIDGVLQ